MWGVHGCIFATDTKLYNVVWMYKIISFRGVDFFYCKVPYLEKTWRYIKTPVRLSLFVSFMNYFFIFEIFLKHVIDMKKRSFIFFPITYEGNNFKWWSFFNNDSCKKLIFFIETTPRKLPFTKASLKSHMARWFQKRSHLFAAGPRK